MRAPADPFTRGFVWGEVGGEAVGWTAHWDATPLMGQTLRVHPLTQHLVGRSGHVRVHCLGMVCDVFDPGLSDHEVVQQLARALATGWTPFYQALKRTGGAYALLVEAAGLYVILDACGMVPVVHGFRSVSSHPRLIAEGRGLEVNEFARSLIADPAIDRGGRYMPGLHTPYDGIESVVPNHRLDVGTGEMDRFYPDTDFRVRPTEEIVELVAPALSGQLSRMDRPLLISLSGGMDSRMTLAASRPVSDTASYFTYVKPGNPILEQDVEIATRMARRLGLSHETYLVPATGPPAVEQQFRLVTDGLRVASELVPVFTQAAAGSHVHVQSNIVELVRGHWSKNPANHPDRMDETRLRRLYGRRSLPEAVPIFADYMERTQFNLPALRGFHWADMYYWEHRLTGWLGGMLRGHRMAVDTYLIYNSRVLLELMMSRPLEDRASARMVALLTEHMWPEVLDDPVFSGSKFFDLRQAAAGVPAPPDDPLPPTGDSRRWLEGLRGRSR